MARVLHQLGQKPLAAQAFEQAMANAKANTSATAALPAEVAHHMGQYLLELGDNAAAVRVLHLALQALSGQELAAGTPPDVNRQCEVC
jgi:hypothetical protein